jgi:hypothetical protein
MVLVFISLFLSLGNSQNRYNTYGQEMGNKINNIYNTYGPEIGEKIVMAYDDFSPQIADKILVFYEKYDKSTAESLVNIYYSYGPEVGEKLRVTFDKYGPEVGIKVIHYYNEYGPEVGKKTSEIINEYGPQMGMAIMNEVENTVKYINNNPSEIGKCTGMGVGIAQGIFLIAENDIDLVNDNIEQHFKVSQKIANLKVRVKQKTISFGDYVGGKIADKKMKMIGVYNYLDTVPIEDLVKNVKFIDKEGRALSLEERLDNTSVFKMEDLENTIKLMGAFEKVKRSIENERIIDVPLENFDF